MRILITGANGFIGTNLANLLSIDGNKIFKGTRDNVDLYSLESIKSFVSTNKIDAIIHCAINGGNRNATDTSDIVYKNILMAENIFSVASTTCIVINIASGAEFNRQTSIDHKSPIDIFDSTPTDYYGFSKNIISKLIKNYTYCVNLRLFGCFYHNELPTRFIRANIERYLNKEPLIIHQNKLMDFFYMEDMLPIIKYYISQHHDVASLRDYIVSPDLLSDINLCYNPTPSLLEVAEYINGLDSYTVPITVENKSDGLNYCGNSYPLSHMVFPTSIKGWKVGIKECYEKLRKNYLLH